MAFQAYTRGILRSPTFTTSGSAPMIADRPSSAKEQSSGNLYYQPYPPVPWRIAKPYCGTGEISSRNRRREKPDRPPLPSSVFRAASAENRQHLDSWTPPSGNAILVPGAVEDPQSSEISLCSSFGNIPDYALSPGQDQRVDINMHYGQPHAYALYDFDTKVEGDLQFRMGDILILEEVVDEAWYRGHSVRTGQVGIFPMNHVEVRIPLATGLYTNEQPKPRIRTISDTKEVKQKTLTTKPDDPTERHLQKNGQFNPTHELNSVPRRPSRVRVSSLRSKYDSTNVSSDEAVHFQANMPPIVLRKSGLRRSQTQYQPLSSMYTNNSVPRSAELEHQTYRENSESNRMKLSSVPSIITTTRPRSQTSVFHMAQNLEQRGGTLNRIKSMPPGGRALFPSSVSPKPRVPSSIPTEQGKTSVDVTPSENVAKKVISPSCYMVPTPLALIAREQNRILGKGKLAPTEAYPSATSSDPQLDKSCIPKAKSRTPNTKENENGVVVSTVSEIDLNQKSARWPVRFEEPVVPTAQPTATYNNTAYSNQQCATITNDQSTYKTHENEVNLIKPSVFQQTMKFDESETPSTLKSREDTLVHEDKPNQEEEPRISFTEDTASRSENLNNWNSWKQSEVDSHAQSGSTSTAESQHPATTTTVKSEQITYVTKMTQDLSVNQHVHTSSSSQPPVNHEVPAIPDSANSLKTVTNPANLDRNQVDNLKEAIFSSLKRNKRSEQWLYVLYNYMGTEPGDLTVQNGSIIRCLDPLPPPTHSNDVNIPERWLRCATWYGHVGQVPSTFVRRILDPEELDRLLQCRPRAQALYDFDSDAKDDLPLKSGDIIYLFEAVDANWYRGESASTGKQGIFPISFVRVIYPL